MLLLLLPSAKGIVKVADQQLLCILSLLFALTCNLLIIKQRLPVGNSGIKID